MIITGGIWVRLLLLGVAVAVLQVAFFSRLDILGSSPDGSLVAVMALGLLGGSLTGTVAGFAIGFGIDCLLLQTLGATSLPLMAVGYAAGRYREGVGRPTRAATMLLGGALTLLGVTVFGAIQVGLGVDADVSTIVIRDAFVKTLLGALLALPTLWLVRLILRPALIDERPARRRAGRPSVAPTTLPEA